MTLYRSTSFSSWHSDSIICRVVAFSISAYISLLLLSRSDLSYRFSVTSMSISFVSKFKSSIWEMSVSALFLDELSFGEFIMCFMIYYVMDGVGTFCALEVGLFADKLSYGFCGPGVCTNWSKKSRSWLGLEVFMFTVAALDSSVKLAKNF